jgi:DUF1680 family protein
MINGQSIDEPMIEAGYVVLERVWRSGDVVDLALSMDIVLLEPHPAIDAVRSSIAIQRGPVVYCLEGIDHPHIDLMQIQLDETAPFQATWRDDPALHGLMAIHTSGYVLDDETWRGHLYRPLTRSNVPARKATPLTAIPYYAWGNRGANDMRVWIPRA